MPRSFTFDLDPVSFLTIGAVGQPGDRTFFLQAAQQSEVVSLLIEKEQALALAAGIEQLFARLQESGVLPAEEVEPVHGNMGLLLPIDASFRVSQMGIGVDEDRSLVVLIAEESGEDDDASGQRARFTASYAQVAALAQQAIEQLGGLRANDRAVANRNLENNVRVGELKLRLRLLLSGLVRRGLLLAVLDERSVELLGLDARLE